MSLAEALLPEFDREMGVTRRLLERVPDGQFAWRPHEKSMTLGRLAEHLAEMPLWCTTTIKQEGIEAASGRPPGYESPSSSVAVLATFDKNLVEARAALVGRTDGELLAPWTLSIQGKEIFSMPKVAVLRSWVMNHMIHHRGQLSVYLRMHNVPLPSMYGPSADEPM
jgi:uncharacterized damage-inducible protein DinB